MYFNRLLNYINNILLSRILNVSHVAVINSKSKDQVPSIKALPFSVDRIKTSDDANSEVLVTVCNTHHQEREYSNSKHF